MPMSLKSEVFKRCPLFRNCTSTEIDSIIAKSTTLSVKGGDPVYVINDPSRFVYIVVSGAIDIVGPGNVRNQYVKMRTIQAGEHFGELSVLVAARHQTSAFAKQSTELLCIAAEDFLALVRDLESLNKVQLELLVGYYLQSMKNVVSLPVMKNANDVHYGRAFARVAPMKVPFGSYKAVPVRLESNVMTLACCLPVSKEFFKSLQAYYPELAFKMMLLEEQDYEPLRKKYLGFYSGQGQNSSLRSVAGPRVTAKVDREGDLEDLRSSTLILSQLPYDLFTQLSPHFEVQDFAEGEVIFSPEKKSDRFYVVGSGNIELSKHVKSIGASVSYAVTDTYDVFFDTSLISDTDLKITAIAKSACRIFSIKKSTFNELLELNPFALHFSIVLAQLINGLNRNISEFELYSGSHPNLSLVNQSLLPQSVVRNSKIVPLDLIEKDLTIGVVSPQREVLEETVDTHLRGFNVKMCLITEEQFQEWTAPLSGKPDTEHTVTVFKLSAGDDRVLRNVSLEPNAALSEIIELAGSSRASDIHFEPGEKSVLVRYRIDGVLTQLWSAVPSSLGLSVTRVLKVLSEMNITESRLPQDGQFKFKKDGRESHFRVSSVPTRFGEKIVLRATSKRNAVVPLQLLAPNTKITRFFNRLVKYQQGILFVTGPTGSGKSTTLYSILNELNSPGKNVVTIEDPIEANLPGINQIEIDPSIGLTHESILRTVLRQDPDVIMIGEIRDSVSMKLALDAALAGQLVLTTIHAGNTFEVIPRIKELGGSTSNIASSLIGVMAQRLVRRLCECKKSRAVTSHERTLFKDLDFAEPLTHVMESVGCSKCNYSGFSGQIPIFEFWEKSMLVHNALTDHKTSEEVVSAIKATNPESLTSYGLKMVAQGLTTFGEVNEALFGITDLMAS